jgi:hypothetical protein
VYHLTGNHHPQHHQNPFDILFAWAKLGKTKKLSNFVCFCKSFVGQHHGKGNWQRHTTVAAPPVDLPATLKISAM